MNLEKLLKRGPLIVFDTETTGLNPDECQIIELAALKIEAVNGKPEITGQMDEFIKLPEGERLPPNIVELTGITDELLDREGGDPKFAACAFMELLEDVPSTLVAHNAHFDAAFLRGLMKGYQLPPLKWLDTLTICRDRTFYPHRLEAMIERYDLKGVTNSHRAIDDARALYELVKALDNERDDLDKYLNLFGVNPKYKVNGAKIRGVTYLNQTNRAEPAPIGSRLFEIARRGFNG